jgi:hypothetical protein
MTTRRVIPRTHFYAGHRPADCREVIFSAEILCAVRRRGRFSIEQVEKKMKSK